MKVTNKLSYDDYNKLCIQNNKHKINYGDCIYYKVANTVSKVKIYIIIMNVSYMI